MYYTQPTKKLKKKAQNKISIVLNLTRYSNNTVTKLKKSLYILLINFKA